jgi:hypothetical protein
MGEWDQSVRIWIPVLAVFGGVKTSSFDLSFPCWLLMHRRRFPRPSTSLRGYRLFMSGVQFTNLIEILGITSMRGVAISEDFSGFDRVRQH